MYLDSDRYVFYTDESSLKSRSSAGIVCYEMGLSEDALSIRLSREWCAMECQIFACYWVFSDVDDLRPVTAVMDCLPVIEMFGELQRPTRNIALANLVAPILSCLQIIKLVWVSGHHGIGGNVVADLAAKGNVGGW